MKYLIPILLLLPQLAFAQPEYGREPYGPPSPLDVCVSPATGEIAVAETEKNQVAILDANWKLERVLGADSGVKRPVSVEATAHNELIVLLGGDTPRVMVFSFDGNPIRQFTCPKEHTLLKDPQGIAADESGNYYIFDTGNHRVVVFDKNGGYLFDFGQYAWTRDYEGKREELTDRLQSPVRGDFLPDGRLIIADAVGPVVNPTRNLRGGRYSVWGIDVKGKTAGFVDWAFPGMPFPTSRVADVAVNRRTGEIYYADGYVPLVDFDFVKHAPKIFAPTDAEVNDQCYMTMTGIKGVAVAPNGEVIVAECDKGVTFQLPQKMFDKNFRTDWPRVARLSAATETTATLQYDTIEQVPTVAKIVSDQNYKYPHMPEGAVTNTGELYDADGRLIKDQNASGNRHRITFTGLQPGKRYCYQYQFTNKAYPGPLFTQARMITTRPPKGKTQYMKDRIIVLLFTNVYEPYKGVPKPGPMTKEEIAELKQRMEVGRQFYWVNSRCKLDCNYEWVTSDREFDRWPGYEWGYWPEDGIKEVEGALEEQGVKHENCAGLFVIYGKRNYDPNLKKWVLTAPGGGSTWGSAHDGSTLTSIGAGGDTAWLMVHEHGHGIDIDYHQSGQMFHFNHFHGNVFVSRYGSSFDGNKAIMRDFKDLEYWSNIYGHLVVVDDKDEDGIPDNDPSCPLDEKRFGSDPTKKDTDNDGLDDFAELYSCDGLGTYPGYQLYPAAPFYLPNPKDKDTDKDGIPDGLDPYPLYPIDPTIYKSPIVLDGKVNNSEYSKGFKRVLADPDLNGDVRVAYTKDYLVFAVKQKAQDYKKPAAMYIEVDANDDGLIVGADNNEFHVTPREDGTCEIWNVYNDCSIRSNATWRSRDYPMPQDCFGKWTKVGDEFQMEFAVPRTPEAGIFLEPWRRMGILIQLKPEGKKERRLFQCGELIEVTLKP